MVSNDAQISKDECHIGTYFKQSSTEYTMSLTGRCRQPKHKGCNEILHQKAVKQLLRHLNVTGTQRVLPDTCRK